VNKKKDKQGQKRVPTEIQWMNIAVDEMADEGYTLDIPQTQVHERERVEGYKVHITNGKQQGEITGNIRTQILEEVKIQDPKRRVATKKSEGTWGKDDANIEWRMTRKTLPARTYKERIWHAKIIHGKMATNDLLVDAGIEENSTCTMCNKKETNAHILHECNSEEAQKQRRRLVAALTNATRECGNRDTPRRTQDWINELIKIYSGDRTQEHNRILRMHKLEDTEWHKAWSKANAGQGRTDKEHMQSRIMETFVRCDATYPIWSGIITKTFMWCVEWANIRENMVNKYIMNIRKALRNYTTEIWKLRIGKLEERTVCPQQQQEPQTQTQESQTYRDRSILGMMQGHTYRTPRTKRKREETEVGNVQAPKKQLKLTGLVNAPAEVGDERKERKKDKQEQGNKRSTQKYKQCNLRTMMGNKGMKESSEKHNREMERAGKEGKGTKKRKKQKNKKVEEQKEKTDQTEIEGRI